MLVEAPHRQMCDRIPAGEPLRSATALNAANGFRKAGINYIR